VSTNRGPRLGIAARGAAPGHLEHVVAQRQADPAERPPDGRAGVQHVAAGEHRQDQLRARERRRAEQAVDAAEDDRRRPRNRSQRRR